MASYSKSNWVSRRAFEMGPSKANLMASTRDAAIYSERNWKDSKDGRTESSKAGGWGRNLASHLALN